MSQGQLTITTRNKLLKILVIFVIAVAITFCGWSYAFADEPPPSAPKICAGPPSKLETKLRGQLKDKLLTYEGCPEEMGAWYMLPMPEKEKDKVKERMQAVHVAVLPNNKVLIVNGSSNRNRITKEEGKKEKIEDGVDTTNYAVVNNTSLFDPTLSDIKDENSKPDFNQSPFKLIDSPQTPINDEPNDLFCSGHLHLPNGDVLFIGGTRLYYPGVKFQGSRQANIYHWEGNSWENLGLTKDGHWYPTLIPLADGAIAAFSGIAIGTTQGVSTIVEIYNPANAEKPWQSIDIKDLPNNPFKTRMNDENRGSDLLDLYPHILPTKQKNRFLITGDGGGKNGLAAHASVNTYFVTFNKDDLGQYSLSFEPGPKRQAINKVYGTSLLDPSSPKGDILAVGGIMGTNNIGIGPGKSFVKGGSLVASLERWRAPDPKGTSTTGSWDIDKDFLAKIDEDILLNTEDIGPDGKVKNLPLNNKYVKQSSRLGRYGKRAMNLAVILPTKEILVVNGGSYPEVHPTYNPTLLIPDASRTDHQGFRTKLMNPDVEPRLYHNNALLLPDARVLVMGGNNSRAAVYEEDYKQDPKNRLRVRLDTKNDFAFIDPGTEGNSGEIWQHAIFYPPYLFGPTERPEIETDIKQLGYGKSETITVSNASTDKPGSLVLVKLGSATHSFDNGQRLVDLAIDNTKPSDPSTPSNATISFTAPTNDHFTPPGYYMLFYVNSAGKPSHAKIVQLVNS